MVENDSYEDDEFSLSKSQGKSGVGTIKNDKSTIKKPETVSSFIEDSAEEIQFIDNGNVLNKKHQDDDDDNEDIDNTQKSYDFNKGLFQYDMKEVDPEDEDESLKQSTSKFSIHDAASPPAQPGKNIFKEKALLQTFNKQPQRLPSPP